MQCVPGQTPCTDGGMSQVPVITAFLGDGGWRKKPLLSPSFPLLSLFSGQVRSAGGILAARKTGLKK